MTTERDRDALRHVLWIGGAPGAGKTSAAGYLAEVWGLTAYHFDRQEPAHVERRDPLRQSSLDAFFAVDMDERWVNRSPEEMAQNTIESWTQRFELVLEDLRTLPSDRRIVAEGPGLFPDCVAPLLTSSQQAIWLVPDQLLLLRVRATRGRGIAFDTGDPPRAFRNLVRRDLHMAEHVRHRCAALGLTLHHVRHDEAPEETVRVVERHFRPLLTA